MTSSWTDDLPDLRGGTWTRLGDDTVRGDEVTERVLTSLAAQTRVAARSQGYAVGWAEGRRVADTERTARLAELEAAHQAREVRREDEHRAAVAALHAVAASLGDAVAGACAAVEERATEVALDLLTVLLDREVEVGADALRRARGLLPADGLAVCRLAPTDAAHLAAEVDGLPAGVRVVVDPALGTGEVVVETDDQVVDARFTTAIDRIRESLS